MSLDLSLEMAPSIARRAARTFFLRAFMEYPLATYLGWVAIGMALLIVGVENNAPYIIISGIAVLGVVVLRVPMTVLLLPELAAYGARRHRAIKMRVDLDGMSVIAGRSSPTLPWRRALRWSEIRNIWEYPDFFLVVVNAGNYWCIPSVSLPRDVKSLIRNIAASKARAR